VGISPAYSFSACVAQTAVDLETGVVTVERIWIAHDIGRAVNQTLTVGQIEGAVYMALGEVLMEEQVFRKGVHKIPSMLEYKSPTVLEMPPVETILVESEDPEGPFGAKEVGQGPLLPVIPAVVNAVYDATGVRFDEIPLSPDKVLAGLELKRRVTSPRVGPLRTPEFAFRKPLHVDPPPLWDRPTPRLVSGAAGATLADDAQTGTAPRNRHSPAAGV